MFKALIRKALRGELPPPTEGREEYRTCNPVYEEPSRFRTRKLVRNLQQAFSPASEATARADQDAPDFGSVSDTTAFNAKANQPIK